MNDEQQKLRNYFLGNLSEKEVQEIDLQIIEDESFSAEVSLAQSTLIEDYLDGDLSSSEFEVFEQNFVITPERRRSVALVSELQRHARAVRKSEKEATKIISSGTPSLGTFFTSLLRPLYVGTAVAAAVLIGIVLWQGYVTPRLSPLEQEYAEINRRDLTDLQSNGGGSAISLIAGNLRDSGSPATRRADTLPESVLFRLGLPAGEPESNSYTARVIKGSTEVFSVRGLRGYQNQAGREVRLLLPRSVLLKGQYQLKLESTASTTTTYVFIIE